MTDELDFLRDVRATADPPSAEARRAARARWSGVEPEPEMPALAARAVAHGDGRGRAFATRTLVATLVVTALVAAGWIVNRDRVNSVKPLHIVTVTSLRPAAASAPQVFLLVGSDSRAFVQSPTQKQEFGDPATTSGARADTIIVVRVDPQTQQTVVVSLPRDLSVDIAGCGKEKLDAAFNDQQACSGGHGGADLLVQTISDDLGIPINHVIEVQFPQFADLAGQLGGLRIDFPAPARDRDTGLDEPAGCTTLDGAQALAFVRSRHLEWLRNGAWVEDPTADLGRMARQQLALHQLAAAAEAQAGTDPRSLLDALFAHVTVDSGFTADDALQYFAAIRDDHTITLTLPTTPEVVAGQDVLLLAPTAAPVLSALAGHGSIGAPGAPSAAAVPQAAAC